MICTGAPLRLRRDFFATESLTRPSAATKNTLTTESTSLKYRKVAPNRTDNVCRKRVFFLDLYIHA